MGTRVDPEVCEQTSTRLVPAVDPLRCEGKATCAEICPTDVFELRKLGEAERRALPMLVRFKVLVHGGKQAFVVRAEACEACGLCVTACPELAVRLVPAASAS